MLLIAGMALALVALREILAANATSAAGSAPEQLYIGLRRSSYGLPKMNKDHAWWISRAQTMAARFPGAVPLMLEIVSNYQEDGSTALEFRRPADDKGPTGRIAFAPDTLDHEAALAAYDAKGVKAILQVESGDADVGRCFEIAWLRFKQHPCVMGFAMDAEWYFTNKSPDKSGIPVPDDAARRWMEQVLGYNKNFVLVLKHWDATHMPKTYRHPHLWFLTDSQEFKTRADWLKDMASWDRAFKGSVVGAQYGYPKDKKWWSKEKYPPVDLGLALRQQAPAFRCLLWVDFTADQVTYAAP